MPDKKCRRCGETKTTDHFNKHNGTADKLDNRCKECVNAANKKRRQKVKTKSNVEKRLDFHEPDVNTTDWQGGKYPFSVFKRKTCKSYIASIAGTQKTFSPDKYGGEEEAKEAAYEWGRETSDVAGLTKNKYRIIKSNKGTPRYLIVQLSDNYVMLCDYKDLKTIQYTNMCAKRGVNSFSKAYAGMTGGSNVKLFHKFKTGFDMTDHINRYPLDNRKANLRSTNIVDNNKNRAMPQSHGITRFDDLYQATIVYTDYGDSGESTKKVLTEMFDSKQLAENWIAKHRRIIDGTDIMEKEQKKLAKRFRILMKKWADGFKWCDEDKQKNRKKVKKKTVEKKKAVTKVVERKKTDKEEIFKKYLEINPDFDYSDLLTTGGKISHVIDGDSEYKYCTMCEEWKSVSDFYANKRNYDDLDRRCKSCKSVGKNASTKAWRERNKERVRAYNKKYRESQKKVE